MTTPTVPTRPSGPSGTNVSALGLGSWHTWDRSEFTTVVDTIRMALEAGVTLFDVGVYGTKEDASATDQIFRRALDTLNVAREDWQLAAKGWLPGGAIAGVPGLEEQLDFLLQRQGTDYAEFLVLGDLMNPTHDYTPFIDQVAAILHAGKARAWAVNNWSAAEVRELTGQARAAGIPGPDFAQLKYGLVRRSVAEGDPYRSLNEDLGVQIQASDTFEGGLIFGPRTDGTPRMIGGNIGGIHDQIRARTGAIEAAAKSLGATPAQLAIAVPLLNPATANVLVGARTPDQLRDNLGAFSLLARHSAAEIRAVAREFWLDAAVVSPDASWGTTLDDDAGSYVVEER